VKSLYTAAMSDTAEPERVPIAVLGGTGQQGRGLARRFARAGFPVVVGSRDPERAAAAIAEWGQSRVTSADYGRAIADADVVVLAVPFDAIDGLLDEHRGRLRPRALVVDVTVPIVAEAGALTLASVVEGSTAQHIKARVPAEVRVAATFKTIPAHLLNDLARPLDCDEFVCGDSADARTDAAALVQSIEGLRAIDIGSLARARSLEHLTLLAIGINRRQKIKEARYRIVGL